MPGDYLGPLRDSGSDAGCACAERADQGDRGKILRPGELALPWARISLSRGFGRGIEAEGNQLYPRRRNAGGGDEAWADRADYAGHAGGFRRDARVAI